MEVEGGSKLGLTQVLNKTGGLFWAYFLGLGGLGGLLGLLIIRVWFGFSLNNKDQICNSVKL